MRLYIDSRTETLRDLLNLTIRDVNLLPLFFLNKDGEDAVDGDGAADPSYMRGNLDMGTNRVVLMADATGDNDLITIQQVEAAQFSAEDDIEQILDSLLIRRDGTVQFGADFSMGDVTQRRVINLGTPTLDTHIETKTRFDTSITAFENDYLPRTGTNPMTGDLDMRESLSVRHKLINVGAPSAAGDLVNLFHLNAQVDIATPQGVPVGAILAYAATVGQVSGNFLACNGQEVSRSLYLNLFNTIGTVYGTPSNAGVFKLPDLRGRIPVGLDNMGGSSANVITDPDADTLGQTFGVALQTLSIPQLPSHVHTLSADDVISSTGGAGVEDGSANENSTNTLTLEATSTNTAGSGDGHPNVQPSMPFTYFIRF